MVDKSLWVYKILVPYEDFARRSSDFAWMIKTGGVWRTLEDKEIESIKV